MLLLPIRLETRFKDRSLLVRIYPDTIAVDRHRQSITTQEQAAAQAFVTAYAGTEGASDEERDLERRAAWRRLCELVGVRRAAFLANRGLDGDSLNELEVVEISEGTSFEPPRVVAQPAHYVVFAYRGDEVIHSKPGQPVSNVLRSLPVDGEDPTFHWTGNFDEAEKHGMGIRLCNLSDKDLKEGFSRIVVVGIRAQSPQKSAAELGTLIEHHRFSEGFAFLDRGTPTNNTDLAASGYSASTDDADAAYERELSAAPGWEASTTALAHNAHRLGAALGLGELPKQLRSIEKADRVVESYASAMQRALWPATGDHYLRRVLKNVLSKAELKRLADHFVAHVRADGPLPLIRVGNQPYGVLPVSSIRTKPLTKGPSFKAAVHSAPTFQRRLHALLARLFDVWLRLANDPERVPRINASDDPDAELASVLAMQPVSKSYRVRPFLDERFVLWLLAVFGKRAFGIDSPFPLKGGIPATGKVPYWTGKWLDLWFQERGQAAEAWAQTTGLSRQELERTIAFRVLGWRADRGLDVPLIAKEEVPNEPASYLRVLAEGGAPTSEALLCDLLKRSLVLANNSPFSVATVRDAIGLLSTTSDDGPDLDRLLRQTLDLTTHRLDAWITSLATWSLSVVRAKQPEGIYLGAYGYLEDVAPRKQPVSNGYIHTPSRSQTSAAAVLYSAYKTHAHATNPNAFCIHLGSERIRRALRILEGVRMGQPLGALLGYEFERALQDRDLMLMSYVDAFRAAFPMVAGKLDATAAADEDTAPEAMAARNVVDGLALARCWLSRKSGGECAADSVWAALDEVHGAALTTELDNLADTLDAVGDVLMYESVYQTVAGNYDRAGAALDAASGNASPPDILESLVTPTSGRRFGQRVCLVLPPASSAWLAEAEWARERAEPRVAAWLSNCLGELTDIGCPYSFGAGAARQHAVVAVSDLDVAAIDLLYMSAAIPQGGATEIEQRVAFFAREFHGLPPDEVVTLEGDRPPDYTYGICEVLEVCRHLLELLAAPTMRPGSLCRPGVEAVTWFTPVDANELLARFEAAIDGVEETVVELGGTLPSAVCSALFRAAACGVEGALPSSSAEPELEGRRTTVIKELQRRLQAARGLLDKVKLALTLAEGNAEATQAPDAGPQVTTLVQGMRDLLGNNLIVLPTFVPPVPDELEEALVQDDLLTGVSSERVRDWLHGCARVHPLLERLDDAMSLVDGFRQPKSDAGEPTIALRVLQLPVSSRKWMALADDEGNPPATGEAAPSAGVLSIVLAAPSAYEPSVGDGDVGLARWAGCLLEHWEEVIPDGIAQTSLGFHCDTPNSHAPQCLLLAVPDQLGPGARTWSPEHLAAIVNDTMDLAKVRGVDLDAMRSLTTKKDLGLGVLLPGLLFPDKYESAAKEPTIRLKRFEEEMLAWAKGSGKPNEPATKA